MMAKLLTLQRIYIYIYTYTYIYIYIYLPNPFNPWERREIRPKTQGNSLNEKREIQKGKERRSGYCAITPRLPKKSRTPSLAEPLNFDRGDFWRGYSTESSRHHHTKYSRGCATGISRWTGAISADPLAQGTTFTHTMSALPSLDVPTSIHIPGCIWTTFRGFACVYKYT